MKKKVKKVKKAKPSHCLTCGGSGWVESEVRCLDCNVEVKKGE